MGWIEFFFILEEEYKKGEKEWRVEEERGRGRGKG